MMQLSSTTQLQDVRALKPEFVDSLEASPTWDAEEVCVFPETSRPQLLQELQTAKTRAARTPGVMRKQARDMAIPGSDFQLLVEKLVQAHLLEVEAARGHGSETGTCSHRSGQSSFNQSGQTPKVQMERGISPSVNSVADLVAARKRPSGLFNMSMTAEQILEAWDVKRSDGHDSEKVRMSLELQAPISDACAKVERKLAKFLLSAPYELAMSCLVLANTLWMAMLLQVEGSNIGSGIRGVESTDMLSTWRTIFTLGDAVFATFFIVEVCFRLLILRRLFCLNWLNLIDLVVAATCVFEVTSLSDKNMEEYQLDALFLLRLLRISKLARALKLIGLTSTLAPLQLLVKCVQSSQAMLFWTFSLLSLLQAIAGITLNMFALQYAKDTTKSVSSREEVFLYYGTFTRSFLTMFEIMFANWGPPCRILVESISEWFAIFFLLYRCVFGFALLNVVTSVFVQQTMKTANSDEELAFKQKEKDKAAYNLKVRKLFQNIDASGDGAINLEEFTKLVQSPKLKFWMSQLELEYHDLLSLFEFLDNGDGEITLTEFIEGAARLRGNAKALDVWRMETKLEVLFDYTLGMLAERGVQNVSAAEHFGEEQMDRRNSDRTKRVQDVLSKSSYKYLQPTTSLIGSRSLDVDADQAAGSHD